jgi:two-component system OmpR family sensor kinase
MKRIIVPAIVAIVLLLCVAVGTWLTLVASVASAAALQARLGAELLDARIPIGIAMARTLARPGLHLTLVDRDAGIVVDAGSAGVATHPLVPIAGSPMAGPPIAGPPIDGPPIDGPPGTAGPGNPPAPPIPQGGDAVAPGPPERARPESGPLGSLALALARIRPSVVRRDARILRIDPDPLELGPWLGADALVTLAGVIAIAGFAGVRSAALARRERGVLEARVAEKREAAERYQRFLAETGHELRTPLTVITGYLDILLAREPDEPPDARVIDGMHAEASRMRVLVDKMLTLARLESDRSIPRLIDIGDAAREAAQTLSRRYPQREIRVADGPSASIIIDADDYAAALGNILENAVKYAPGSPILIETALRDGSASTAVIDRGPGIAPGDEQTIFERFYRGRAFGEGLGLGHLTTRDRQRLNDPPAGFESHGRLHLLENGGAIATRFASARALRRRNFSVRGSRIPQSR